MLEMNPSGRGVERLTEPELGSITSIVEFDTVRIRLSSAFVRGRIAQGVVPSEMVLIGFTPDCSGE